jgi:hypothetical protein
LQSDFCQLNYTPKLVQMGLAFIARFRTQVKRYCDPGVDSAFFHKAWIDDFSINNSIARLVAVAAVRMPH